MKFKQIFSLILVLSLFGSIAAFAAAPGSTDDPLISKSYIDNTYRVQVMAEPNQLLKDSIKILEYKLNQAAGTDPTEPKTLRISQNGSFTAGSGSSFTLISGTASVSSLAGALIDVTDGKTLSSGSALSSGHRYVAAGNSSVAVKASSAAVLAILGDVSVSSGLTVSFPDVLPHNWFYSSVLYAAERGLVNGRDTGYFDPEDYMTVAEAIKLGACIHQLYHQGSVTLVNGSPWYMSYVYYAAENGIISKIYSNYDAKINREEFVNIFYSALPADEYTQINTIGANSIPDVSASHPYYSRILAFYRAGILTGKTTAGDFLPKDNIKRGEVSAIIERMLEESARKSFTL